MSENTLQENLKAWEDFCKFMKSLNDTEVDEFIKYGKETCENFGNDDSWLEIINKIKNK